MAAQAREMISKHSPILETFVLHVTSENTLTDLLSLRVRFELAFYALKPTSMPPDFFRNGIVI